MAGYIATIVRFWQTARRISSRKWSFLGIFAFIFLGNVLLLRQLDLLPDVPSTKATAVVPTISLAATVQSATSTPVAAVIEEPVKIEIPTIGLNATIANPTTTDTNALDQLLLKGAVRYPTTAKLGEIGNVVLFGHSSYLPVVGNQAYKTFNGIQKLTVGDTVTVYSLDTAYTYAVRSVEKESAASGAGISLAVTSRVLTLATCDSFGAKTDRFVITADFVESHPLST